MRLADIDTRKVKHIKDYKPGISISVDDTMQDNYSYELTARYGMDFADNFKPELTPLEMLSYGVFEGKYLNDCYYEFPFEWYVKMFDHINELPEKSNKSFNYFKIKSRQSLQVWREKGWIQKNDPDVRGWFQWYCRYYIGRRVPALDERQIKRWRAFYRHAAQVYKNCDAGDVYCRPKQRQALLQWAYNPFI